MNLYFHSIEPGVGCQVICSEYSTFWYQIRDVTIEPWILLSWIISISNTLSARFVPDSYMDYLRWSSQSTMSYIFLLSWFYRKKKQRWSISPDERIEPRSYTLSVIRKLKFLRVYHLAFPLKEPDMWKKFVHQMSNMKFLMFSGHD